MPFFLLHIDTTTTKTQQEETSLSDGVWSARLQPVPHNSGERCPSAHGLLYLGWESHCQWQPYNHVYFQPFKAIAIISQTRQICQEMLKSESSGSESAQAMRNDSEVHYGYLSQHHFHAALLNHSHGHCQLQGLSSGLS